MLLDLTISSLRAGLCEVTVQLESLVQAYVREPGRRDGLCTVFVRHTSASLLIQENADPDVRRDLDAFFARLGAGKEIGYAHDRGPGRHVPSHAPALTATSFRSRS
jgi:secondary thiamine-phosphate synthase enzyme